MKAMNGKTMFDLTGKKAMVTGGTRGLGRGMAEGLMEAGCEVAIVGTTDRVYEVAEEFTARGFHCHGIQADFSDRAQVLKGFDDCVKALGGALDILVAAHGIQRRNPAADFTLEDWDTVLQVDLSSVFVLCQAAGKLMMAHGGGKIINVGSMVSFFGGMTIPAYAAAKGGVTQLTKELNNEWMGKGINVNAIAPGYMETEMNTELMDPKNPRFQQICDRIPAGRWGTCDDIKGVCIFLASHASDYLGGVVIPLDGGYLVK